MRLSTRLRVSVVALAAAVTAALAPGVAHAAPPAGDDFDTATEITALPFSATIDTTGSTKAPDDPTSCYSYSQGSVWLKYTAPSDGIVRAKAQSGRYGPLLSVHTGQRGALSMEPGTCTYSVGGAKSVHVEAGRTYYFLLAEYYAGGGGPVTFTLNASAPEPNDSRASAAVASLPSTFDGDLSRATAEPGEVPPSCDTAATRSVWYSYTTTRDRFVQVVTQRASISVHLATDLSEVDCVSSEAEDQGAVFAAKAGQTYLVRLAEDAEDAGTFTAWLQTAPEISPFTYVSGFPSVYADLWFNNYSGDPAGRPLVSGTVDLGDGTTHPVTTPVFQHRYAEDGTYRVVTTGTTADGRTGSSETEVKVETHDVSIAALTVPTSARAGQTKPIKVSVANTRYAEDVKVTLYKVGVNGAYDQEIGHSTQRVAASPTGQVVFPFAYTYSAQDATTGAVTFRAKAVIENWSPGDPKPDDNEARATTATVRPAAGGNARTD
ncbi:PKD domain-containing protein [Lentzea sp. HUAS12]|uniref:PKD domain-containing protein n=1 Tax=Lentzea sp. HUAS12 TaxID=2951806 RepID=UPI0020A186CA|nr:PKD domain-containing protein [Lentzea sp. HUAS12]USX48615.1 PKD domain-containing protein [Lentzea sp. HUAS12]